MTLLSLIKDRRAAGVRPRVHPNGFLQLDLDASRRPCKQCISTGWKSMGSVGGDSSIRCLECKDGYVMAGGNERLHIWHPDLPRQKTYTGTHDHIFDMQSTVIKGRLWQVRKNYDLQHNGDPTHEIYMAKYSAKSQSKLEGTGVLVHEHPEDPALVYPSQTYWQPAFTFHESRPDTEIVITCMIKTQGYEGNPRVLVPLDRKPDNDFERDDAPEDQLWEIIEQSV